MTQSELDTAVAVNRALAHPARLRALAMLRTGELCVCQITEVLGLAPSTVSAHLRELRLAGLIRERKEGRWVYVAIDRDGPASSWIECALKHLCDAAQVTEDARLVAELRQLPVEDVCRLGLDEARRRSRPAAEEVRP